MECRVEFDYIAQEPDELTIKKGDIIKNVHIKMDGWYEGSLRGKTGVFPDNFVKLIEQANPAPKPSEVVLRNNPSSARRVKVLFSYSPEQDDELPLEVGEVLDFIEEVEEGWWRGKLKGREGIFPSNFVEDVQDVKVADDVEGPSKITEERAPNDASKSNHGKGIPVPDVVPTTLPPVEGIDDEPAPELPPKPVRELARCFYPYTALNEDELGLTEGDIVTIISKQCEDEGWWRGELRGKIGLFPDNFVKIITPGEAQSGGVITNATHGKILAQERNVPATDVSAKNKRESVVGETTVDGSGLSRSIGAGDKSGESKIELAKAKLNKTNSKDSQQHVPIPVPKVGHVATSPISPGIAAFHSNLFSNQQKPTDAFAKSKDLPAVHREERNYDESEDFNSVERTETLNHLTATRAKAPKRRPPSTIITRENETPMLNGSAHGYDNSITDTPPQHFSTPLNHSGISNGTMSGSFTDGGSSLNQSGSFHSHNTRSDKEGSPTPSSANSSAVGATKPKKQTLPWMAELKQTQDKKRNLTSPVGNLSTTATTIANTTIPSNNSSSTQAQSPSTAKAPPLPAKPTSLSSVSSSFDKTTSNNLNHVPSMNNSGSSPIYGITNKSKKSTSPAPPTTINQNHHTTTNSGSMISSGMDNNSHIQREDGENSNITFNKGYVTLEEYQALKTRVTCLENEVETLKRQLKLLLDRDLRGHIV